MAPLIHFTSSKLLITLYLLFIIFSSLLLSSSSQTHHLQPQKPTSRLPLQIQKLDQPKNKSTSTSPKNQTKLIKPTQIKTLNSTKTQLKNLISTKPQIKNLNSTKTQIKNLNSTKTQIKNLNSTKAQIKKLNFTSKNLNSTKVQFKKLNFTSKNTTPTKPTSKSPNLLNPNTPQNTQTPKKTIQKPNWIENEEKEEDLVSEFRNLPTQFHQNLIPDLTKISTTSRIYLNKANKEITKGFKPLVGYKYATTIASTISFAFILIPLILVSLIINRIKSYFSIQKIVIFIQIYLSIYFSILSLSSLVTGLEPLKFFYATSQSTYVCLQVIQTLGYVFYLLLLLMYLILVFSTECGLGSKMLGLGQTFVGFAVGLHYYVSVFHRAVLHQPPKTNWKVHGIYATCFLVICLLARAERRKKAYPEEGGEEGKKS